MAEQEHDEQQDDTPEHGDDIVMGILGAAVGAGHPVYLDHATNKYFPVDTNLAGHAADQFGMTLDAGDIGDQVRVQTSGVLQPGDAHQAQQRQQAQQTQGQGAQTMPAPEVPGEQPPE